MGLLRFSHYLEKRHARSIVVDEYFATLVDALRSVLFHLDALNQNVALLVLVVVELQSPVQHDWIVLLCDLVSLRQVRIRVVLTVEFDFRQNTATKSEGCFHCLIQAMFVQNRQHPRQCQVNKIRMNIRLLQICT